jgi:hypothetical protein
MSQTKLSLAGNNLIIPGQEELPFLKCNDSDSVEHNTCVVQGLGAANG